MMTMKEGAVEVVAEAAVGINQGSSLEAIEQWS